MKIKAAVLYKLHSPLVIEEVEIPSLKNGQVLVKILSAGVCRAQYNELIGLKGPDKFLPHLLGHEASAQVVDVSRGVKKVTRGDYVVLSWIKGDGLEVPSSKYRCGKKIINAGAVTTFSEYAIISENRMTKIPRQVPPDIAAILGCAVATGAGIIDNALKAEQGRSLAVFGVGGVGSSSIMAARRAGCKPVIALDVVRKKLNFARSLGATHALLFNKKQSAKQIFKICKSGVDYAIDASGQKDAMECAFETIKDTGTFVIAGNLKRDEQIAIHPSGLIRGKKIIGTWGGGTRPSRDIPRYANEYLKGRLPLNRLITHQFNLKQINQAFAVLKRGEAGRIIICIHPYPHEAKGINPARSLMAG